MVVKSRREEYSEATRAALVASARTRFVEQGYADTSIEDIVTGARVTRGAFYHHFDSKQDAFEVVFGEVHATMLASIGKRMTGIDDVWDSAIAGIEGFLDICLDRDYQRIALQEAPIALGWQRYRELDEHHAFGIVRGMVQKLMDEGLVDEGPVEICARILFATFAEAAHAIASADDMAAARDHASRFLGKILNGLRTVRN
ncbi:MAG TPA: TetR/AcrR family transcriptional regulator [Actinomycetota bacterium]|nr:TetR/AcrR family transcriptional regulator [Actinomycetota bacterium]